MTLIPNKMRKIGFCKDVVPWGTHFLYFYKSKKDLLELLVPYFTAGLKNNEACIWVTSELSEKEAMQALEEEVGNLKPYLCSKQLMFFTKDNWYLNNGKFVEQSVLNKWLENVNKAKKKGFDGLRVTGNTLWIKEDYWHEFLGYECAVNNVVGNYKLLAICTYPKRFCSSEELVEATNAHGNIIVKNGKDFAIKVKPIKKIVTSNGFG